MAADADILHASGATHRSDVSAVEDVLGLIEILTATENSIFNKLGKSSARDMVHHTLTDTLRTATLGAFATAEVADFTLSACTTPSRVTNHVQIFALPFGVSRTQQQIEHYHGENELARQTAKALKDWHNAVEIDLIYSSLVSGVSGTAPKMNGIIKGISTSNTYTALASGTVWSASIFKGQMKNIWDNSNGDMPTEVYMGSFLKDKTDDFTNKTSTSYTGTNQREIINVVNIYETGFGRVNIYAHRYMQSTVSGYTSYGRVLAIRPDSLKIAFLQRPMIDTGLARKGDYDERAVIGKLTLEVRNAKNNFFIEGMDID